MRAIVIVCSYHHKNTEKVAMEIARVLDAKVFAPQQIAPQALKEYDLIGIGSGIYDARHHQKILEFADNLPVADGKKAFLFSTDGMPRALVNDQAELSKKMYKDHEALRKKVQAKGYTVCGEFGCAGFNTNSFLKWFGGINKGRPDENDLAQAAVYANGLIGKER